MFKTLNGYGSLVLLTLLTAASCSGDPNPTTGGISLPSTPPPGADRALFVGNSLTAANDLPLIVEALAGAGGHPFFVESITYGGVSSKTTGPGEPRIRSRPEVGAGWCCSKVPRRCPTAGQPSRMDAVVSTA